MRRCNRPGRGLLHVMALTVTLASLPVLTPAPASAQVQQPPTTVTTVTRPRVERDRSTPVLEPMNSSERQAYACLIGGGASLAAVAAVGANEGILVVTGGTLIPTSPVLLWSALAGTLFASVCAASAVAVPAFVRLWDYYYEGMRPVPGTPAPPADE